MKRIKHKIIEIIVLVIFLMSLASCTSTTKKPTITWLFGTFQDERRNYEEIEQTVNNQINQYLDKISANYQVNLKLYFYPSFDDADSQLTDIISQGDYLQSPFGMDELSPKKLREEYPDADLITIVNGFSYMGYRNGKSNYEKCAESLLLNLDDLLKSESGTKLTQYMGKDVIERAKIDHKLYGLPLENDYFFKYQMPALNFNKEAIEKLGLDFDADEISQSNLEDLEPFLHNAKDHDYTPLTSSNKPYFYSNLDLSYTYFGDCPNLILTADNEFKSYWDLPEVKERLELFYKWKSQGLITFSGDNDPYLTEYPFIGAEFAGDLEPFDNQLTFYYMNNLTSTDSITIPLINNILYIDSAINDGITSIFRESKNPELAFDFLCRIISDENIIDILTNQDVVLNTKSPELLAHLDQNIPNKELLGFRFNPEPVLEEVKACNYVIGYFSNKDEKKLSPAVQALYNLEEPIDQNLSKVQEELKTAGIDEIIAEAQRQLDQWLESKPK